MRFGGPEGMVFARIKDKVHSAFLKNHAERGQCDEHEATTMTPVPPAGPSRRCR